MFTWKEVSTTRIICQLDNDTICVIDKVPNGDTWSVHVPIYRDLTTWKALKATNVQEAEKEALALVKDICVNQVSFYSKILSAY